MMMRSKRLIAETITLAVMGGGILMVWQPWVHALFAWGFPVTIIGIVSFIVAAHLPEGEAERD
jgi:hypothetical protein